MGTGIPDRMCWRAGLGTCLDAAASPGCAKLTGVMTGLRWLSAGVAACAVLIAASAVTAQQDITAPSGGAPGDPQAVALSPADREVFDYSVEWRLIPAGTAKLSWTAMPHSAVAVGQLRLHLQSAGLVSRLFRVD